jgi:hypothetical protein
LDSESRIQNPDSESERSGSEIVSRIWILNQKEFKIRIVILKIQIQNPDSESEFRIWIQNQNPQSEFRIQVENQNSESESRIGIRIQNIGDKKFWFQKNRTFFSQKMHIFLSRKFYQKSASVARGLAMPLVCHLENDIFRNPLYAIPKIVVVFKFMTL